MNDIASYMHGTLAINQQKDVMVLGLGEKNEYGHLLNYKRYCMFMYEYRMNYRCKCKC